MDKDSIPALAHGCRLHPTQDVLLVPEGTLQLAGPTRDVLARVDGTRTVTAIVDELLQEYEGADATEVRTDVLALLASLEQRGVVPFDDERWGGWLGRYHEKLREAVFDLDDPKARSRKRSVSLER